MIRLRGRKAISLALIAMMVTGCTKAVEIPREEFEAASQDQKVAHRITMKDGPEYTARRFSISDSTLVITELHHSNDWWYASNCTPITLRRDDVESIERLELNRNKSFFVLLGVGLLALTVTAMGAIASAFAD